MKTLHAMTGSVAFFALLFIVGTAAIVKVAYAQNGYPSLNNAVQTRPQAIPTSLTTVISQDAYICLADFTATGQTILVQDRQGAPVVWINNTLGASMSATTWIFGDHSANTYCRFFPNGISIQAGSSGVTGYLVIKCPSKCALNWGF